MSIDSFLDDDEHEAPATQAGRTRDRRRSGESPSGRPSSMGHTFSEHLVCACGVSYAAHQRAPSHCRFVGIDPRARINVARSRERIIAELDRKRLEVAELESQIRQGDRCGM